MRTVASLANMAWLVGFAVWMGCLVGLLFAARPVLIESFGTVAAQRDWNEFVEAARRQSEGEGPVQRRVPRSPQPPALVLMRDYFAICVAAAVLFGSVLFLVMMLLIRGIFARPFTRDTNSRTQT